MTETANRAQAFWVTAPWRGELRRETLPVTGWIMGFFGASLLWGGFAVCVAIARKTGRHIDPEAD